MSKYDKNFDRLAKNISILQKTQVNVKVSGDNLNFVPNGNFDVYSDEIAPFMSLVIKNDSISVSQIYLKDKRKGTGTKIFKWLFNYAYQKGYKYVDVKIVQTEAMQQFCEKLDMKKYDGNNYRKIVSVHDKIE